MPTYTSLLRRPGAAALVTAGILARLPVATYGIGLLALGRAQFGAFGPAGVVVASYVVAAVASSLALGSQAQRPWFPRLLAAAAAVDALALVALVSAAYAGAGPAALAALAALVGLALPPAGVIARIRWSGLVPAADLDAALFLESALDEAIFVVGPVLVIALGTLIGPGPALLAAGALTTAGLLGLAAGRPGSQPPGGAASPKSPPPVSVLARLYVGFVALGAGFAAIQVGVLAWRPGSPGSAGLVLTSFSLVSLAAGLTAGRLGVSAPLRAGLAFLGAALLLPPLVGETSMPTLALLLVPAAVAASPSVALGFAQAAGLTEPVRRGSVFAWCGAALGVGLALGDAAGGLVADLAGPSAPFLVGTVAVLLGAAVAPAVVAGPAAPPRHCSGDLGVAADGAGGRDHRPSTGGGAGDPLRPGTGGAPRGGGGTRKDPVAP